ncbi:MAG: HEAT repeat domain-containing protein [Planctomycetota bacterium]
MWKSTLWAVAAITVGALLAIWRAPSVSPRDTASTERDSASEGGASNAAPESPSPLSGRDAANSRLRTVVGSLERLSDIVAATAEEGNVVAVDLLHKLFERVSAIDSRIAVLDALEQIGDPTAVRALAAIARGSEDFGDQAAVHLSSVDSRAAAPALVEVFEEENRKGPIAAAAIRAIGRTRLREHLSLVMAASGVDDVDVVIAATMALGSIGDPEGVSALRQALESETSKVRRAAIRSLGKIRSEQTVQALEAHAKRTSSEHERELVKEALDGLRGVQRSPLGG